MVTMWKRCPTCAGRGWLAATPQDKWPTCPECRGAGWKLKDRRRCHDAYKRRNQDHRPG